MLSFAFAGGMLLAIGILAASVIATAGFAVAGLSAVTNYVIAAIFLVAGLHLIGIMGLPLRSFSLKAGKRKGVGAAIGIGLVFGIGLSPCTFAFLAPIIGVAFAGAAKSPLRGFALFLAFGLGHCGVIGLAGSSTELVQRYLDWNERSRALKRSLKITCGVLVLLAAGVLVYTA